ncbi:hypothetical protein CN211_12690 [Sinorhizobium meliloti]|nr:hypothetical protein CN211_12690 [Sinorhizobium meliloti]
MNDLTNGDFGRYADLYRPLKNRSETFCTPALGKYKKVCVTDPDACRRYGAKCDRSGYSGKCRANP